MIYSLIVFIIVSLLYSSSSSYADAQQQAWPSSIGSFNIPGLSQIMNSINSIPQFNTMQMPQMQQMQMPSFRSMPSMGSFPSPSLSSSSASSSTFSVPSSAPRNFPTFQPSFPSFPSSGQGGNQPQFPSFSVNQNANSNQPQPPPFSNQNNQQHPPSLSNLPTPDPRVMQNALSSIGNTIQQNIRPNANNNNNNANPIVSSPTSTTPSTSSLPPYPYSSDTAKIDAALRQMMPGYDTMTPAALQATISSLSDKDMEAFQKEIGIDNSKFSKLSIFEAPFAPSTSCHQLDFGCQSYSSCFSCYQNRAQPKCGACLQLRSCSDSSLSCFLDGICRLCDASNSAPMCAALQKRCSTTGPPHP